MESELETLQEERTNLKDEMETQRRTCSGMEKQIETLMAEVSTPSTACKLKHQNAVCMYEEKSSTKAQAIQFFFVQKLTTLQDKFINKCGIFTQASLFLQTTQLRSELVSCSEERDDLNQSLSQCRAKVHSLEKTNCDTRNIISILEDDIRAGRKEYEALQNSMEKLKTERQQVCTRKNSRVWDSAQLFVSFTLLDTAQERLLFELVYINSIKNVHESVTMLYLRLILSLLSSEAVRADKVIGASDIQTERRKRGAYWEAWQDHRRPNLSQSEH